jgi:hypothetical protein
MKYKNGKKVKKANKRKIEQQKERIDDTEKWQIQKKIRDIKRRNTINKS